LTSQPQPQRNFSTRLTRINQQILADKKKINDLSNRVSQLTVKNKPKKKNNKQQSQKTKSVPTSRAQPINRLQRTVAKLGKGVNTTKNMKTLTPLHAYAKCRIDPFQSTGSLGIPDTCGYRRIIVDYKGYADITVTSNCNMQLILAPFIPFTSGIKVSNANSVNYNLNGNAVIPAANTDYSYGWFPLQIFPELLAAAAVQPGALYTNPYMADKARIVTLVSRITYTGPALSPQGMATVSSLPFSIQRGSATDTTNVAIAFSNGTSGNYSNAPFQVINTNIVPNIYTQDSVVHRPEVGDVIVAKHNGSDYTFKPMYRYPVCLVDKDAPNYSGGQYGFFGGVTSITANGLLFFDEDWEGTLIQLSGLAAGMSFRLEQYLCVEYTPEQGSPFMRLAQIPPTVSESGLKLVDSVVKQIPVSVPLNEGVEPWYKIAAKAISSIGGAAIPLIKYLL